MTECINQLALIRKEEQNATGRLIYRPGFIMRIKDIKTSHIEGHMPFTEERKSLALGNGRKVDDSTYYMVIDDVTTTGRSLKLCKDLLVSSGAMPEKVILLALAKTLHKN